MSFFKNNLRIYAVLSVVLISICTFSCSNKNEQQNLGANEVQQSLADIKTEAVTNEPADVPAESVQPKKESQADKSSFAPKKETPTPENVQTAVPQTETAVQSTQTPLPAQSEKPAVISEKEKLLTCTMSVKCDTILENMDKLAPEKVGLVPKDGVVFAETEVSFTEGESVFDVLVREMKKNKIHLEFANTPGYGTAYIEGINNIYEFDCGEMSGWLYRVNGASPGMGCSKYFLKQGDRIEWIYTCNFGEDI